ncbi:uncharacterized protein LOC119646247 [Hermetia illucens]|uniref:uncharacterized protein LOC119646247 n=1 Tax=Hermetia illucens TaxID=343691 RepID=UPI0018CC63ED|nr:uncharacterized protein LOC119646247 [Hermetia illucens]
MSQMTLKGWLILFGLATKITNIIPLNVKYIRAKTTKPSKSLKAHLEVKNINGKILNICILTLSLIYALKSFNTLISLDSVRTFTALRGVLMKVRPYISTDLFRNALKVQFVSLKYEQFPSQSKLLHWKVFRGPPMMNLNKDPSVKMTYNGMP